MTATLEDDLNHLLVTSRLNSDLAAGIRYAYYRLDTIDRKASEVSRSVGFLLTIVIALCSFERERILSDLGAGRGLTVTFVISVLLFLLVSLTIAFLTVKISRLRFFRFDRQALPYNQFQTTTRLDLFENNQPNTHLITYFSTMAAVTLRREASLRRAGDLYYAALLLFLISIVFLFFVTG